MKDIQKRFIGFLLLCIPARLFFVYLAYNLKPNLLQLLGYLALLPAIGFSFIYLTNIRKSGAETFGKKIWWNSLRPIHAFLYFYFAYLAINKKKNAFIPLLIDVIVGLISFIVYHYHINSFAKLF